MFFILSKTLLFLTSPFAWMIGFMFVAFFHKKELWRKRSKWVTLSIFLIFSNNVIFLEFCRLWEIPGSKIENLEPHDLGIVLTGMGEYNKDLDVVSIRRGGDRIWQALSLYHNGKIQKILVTGDNGYITDRGLHEAKQIKEVLVSWGIPKEDIITEEKSRNTYENALETKKILSTRYPHMNSFLLITSGTHMKRSLACFKKQEMRCTPFSTDLHTGPTRGYFWDQYIIPDVSTFSDWNKLTKEWIGFITYDIIGYL